VKLRAVPKQRKVDIVGVHWRPRYATGKVTGMPLRYQVDRLSDEVSVKLTGELDMSTADELRDVLIEAIGEPPAAAVDVDLGEVSFLDSSSIAALVKASNKAAEAGCRFSVSQAHGIVRRVLDITGLLDVLTEPAATRAAD
jgi:anti-sigma B factor antagonist